jgi:hypothetical protein
MYIQSARPLIAGETIQLSVAAVVLAVSPDGKLAEVELAEHLLASSKVGA